MKLTNHDSKSYEKILSTFDLKFPRKYGAERLRKGFPSLRLIFDELQEGNKGNPPSPLVYSHTVWERCEGLDESLRDDVEARARRAHPSFCREVHLYLLLRERFGDSAEIVYDAQLDMKNKIDFLIQSPVEPVAIRLHTHVETWRSNYWIGGKEPQNCHPTMIRKQKLISQFHLTKTTAMKYQMGFGFILKTMLTKWLKNMKDFTKHKCINSYSRFRHL